MKRICFFSGDITRSGGTERVATMIANELAKQGHYDIIFLSLCEQNEKPFYDLEQCIKRYKLGEKWLNPGPAYLPLIPKLRRFLKEQSVDVIIDIDIVLDILSIPASCRMKTKVVSWEHFNCQFEMSVLYRKLILKYSINHSDFVVTLTERDKQDYKRVLKRTQNIEAIYNPMGDVEDIEEKERNNSIITVGRLVPEKGIQFLANVAARVLQHRPDWKWYVLGEGVERNYLEKFIIENKLEDKFILSGLVADVGTYLKQSKIFVLTSKSEGLGMCLLEAKAYGLPCISFDVPTGPSEIIEDNVNGFLIKPFDCEEMSIRILELMNDKEKLKKLASESKRNIDKFKMENIIKKWNRVLDNLCE